MRQHEQILSDPVGTLRSIWDDTGWRFVILTSLLIFLLETIGELANVDQASIWWGAELLTAVVVARGPDHETAARHADRRREHGRFCSASSA